MAEETAVIVSVRLWLPKEKREFEINRGCWGRPAAPPCGEREYEWNGLCYVPIFVPTAPGTSQQ